MLRSKYSVSQSSRTPKLLAVSASLLVAGVAGCSADVTRFDRSLFDGGSSTGSVHQSATNEPTSLSNHTPSRSYNAVGLSNPSPSSSPAPSPSRVESTQLAPVTPAPINSSRPTRSSDGSYQVADATSYAGDNGTLTDASRGDTGSVTVRSGDTLYGIARRYSVSVGALKRANGLSTHIIRPGQTLVLPGSNPVTGSRPVLPPQTVTEPSYDQSAASGTYIVRPGDSLYKIARKTGVSIADLQQFNDVRDVRRLMPGTVLRLNNGDTNLAARETRRTEVIPSTRTYDTRRAPATSRAPSSPSVINSQPTSTRNQRTLTDAAPDVPRVGSSVAGLSDGSARSTTGFRWPATGRIVSRFGPRNDGSHNDGIDISVPIGTDIVAAESGIVAYADDELKAYGNLVLIRHDNGWVSAYAHADQLLVARGDEVRRGQVIAKAGKTGNVDRPTLHFELRDGAKPVDPLPHLPRPRR